MANKKRSRKQSGRRPTSTNRPSVSKAQRSSPGAAGSDSPAAKEPQVTRRASEQGARPASDIKPRPSQASSRPASSTPVQPERRAAVAQSSAEGFAAEYAYVLSDLKRLGLVAAALLALIVILSFFI